MIKTIGLIGGTGWISTLEYYQKINENVNILVGGMHSAKIILNSINFGELDALNKVNDMQGVQNLIMDAVDKVVSCKVDGLALCANTLHLFTPLIKGKYNIPIIHIGEATGKQINSMGMKKAGLLGTLITMEQDFYKDKLSDFHIETLLPEKDERLFIHRIIMHELMKGVLSEVTKTKMISIIDNLKAKGAECVILGCTEIPLMIKQYDVNIPLINTLEIHCDAIAKWIINDNKLK